MLNNQMVFFEIILKELGDVTNTGIPKRIGIQQQE